MRGEVGETYWGGACDLLCISGFGAFRDESIKKKIVGRVRVMRVGWSVESYEVGDFWNSNTEKRGEKLLLVGWELWEVGEFNISGVRVYGEFWDMRESTEKRGEMRWLNRGEETKFKKKKSWSMGPSTIKKVE